MTKKTPKNARTLASERPSRKAGKGGVVPPKARQFGQPSGNKRGKGFWKKEATPRYKLEQMMLRSTEELQSIIADETAPAFERKLAKCLLEGSWKEIEAMINQVYGMPKQPVDNGGKIELVGILPKLKRGERDAQ